MKRIARLSALTGTVAVVACGCGGGGVTPSGGSGSSSGTGNATFQVYWPVASRLVPSASNSIKIEISSGDSAIASEVLDRPASSAIFDRLPIGDHTATATAYPVAGASGVPQATGSVPLRIENSKNTAVTLTMASTIAVIDVSPGSVSIRWGHAAQLTATAKDSKGNVVLVSGLSWSSSDPSIVTVDPSGRVVGAGFGGAEATVHDTESGKSASATISVGKIAFTSTRDSWFQICAMNADRSGQVALTNSRAYNTAPSWSPDGSKIAFQSDTEMTGSPSIHVMNADGSGQQNITNNSARDVWPAWSPDGKKIAFVSDRDGNNEIYVMNADGTGQVNLTNNSADDSQPAW